MNFATIGQATMDVVLVFDNVDTSLYAWSSFALYIYESIDDATSSPTAPTSLPSDSLSVVPNSSPTPTSQPTPTPSNIPIIAPTPLAPAPLTPTPLTPAHLTPTPLMPVPTITTVVTGSVNVSIDELQLTFTGVRTISANDLLSLQTTMEGWYVVYFNQERNVTEQRHLIHHQQHHHRGMQRFRVPAVQNMKTMVIVTNQDPERTDGSNTITYTQQLAYTATIDAREPEYYALLPFVDTEYKNELLQRLKSDIGSFANLALTVPSVSGPPIGNTDGDDSLTVGAIIGIVTAVIGSLVLVAGMSYFVRKRKLDDTTTTPNNITQNTIHTNSANFVDNNVVNTYQTTDYARQLPSTNEPENTIHIHVPDEDTPIVVQAQASRRLYIDPLTRSAGYDLTYKDQSRSVIRPQNPIIQAVFAPNRSNDNTVIPIAAAVVAVNHVRKSRVAI